MATKKKSATVTVDDQQIIDISDSSVKISSKVEKATESPGKFQTYNWWLDTVVDETWAYHSDVFTGEEIANIIKIGTSPETSAANDKDVVDGIHTRSWIRSDVPENRWIFQRLVNVVNSANDQFFNFDLNYIDSLQFVAINKDSDIAGKYTDIQLNSTGTKKLSFLVQLSAPADYEGGELLLHTQSTPLPLPKVSGTVNTFPSWVLREMLPVTSGTNYVLLGTVTGPRFK